MFLAPKKQTLLSSGLLLALLFAFTFTLWADDTAPKKEGSVSINLKRTPVAPAKAKSADDSAKVKEPEDKTKASADQATYQVADGSPDSGSQEKNSSEKNSRDKPSKDQGASGAPSPDIFKLKLLPKEIQRPGQLPARASISDSPSVSIDLNKSPKKRQVDATADSGDGSKPKKEVDCQGGELELEDGTGSDSDPSLQVKADECPGSPQTEDGSPEANESAGPLQSQPDDIPLEQEEHPFDVPAAKATKGERRLDSADASAELLSENDAETNRRIEACLNYYRTHHENVARRGPWALMHTILPYGVEIDVIAGKGKVNAIGWLCHNGVSARQRMFQPTKTGFRPNVGPGVQGHEGQFAAILAQSHVQSDYPLQIGKRKFELMDLVKYEMATCREKTELTFKLIAFAHYLEPNQTWRDNRGRPWSIEKLVAEELAQPINGAACGGTHRLMGLTCAIIRRQEAGLPLTGHFLRAEKFLDDFVAYTLTLQNPDGSFSTEWFERRANEPNVERKVQTTGHILEWLVYTVSDEHLRTPEIQKAVDFLLDNLGEKPEKDWPIGPQGHSLRALSLYQKRALQTGTQQLEAKTATQSNRRSPSR
jgi:hypothetical protein